MLPITWQIYSVVTSMPWEKPGERLMEINAGARWEEPDPTSSQPEKDVKAMPSVNFTFWLPERRDWALTQIEEAAFAYVREHLPHLVAALPPART